MKFLSLILIASLLSANPAGAAPACQSIFIENTVNRAVRDLADFILKIDAARAEGKDSVAQSALQSDYKLKEQALLEHIEKSKLMTRAELAEKLKQEIVRLQLEHNSEKQQQAQEQERKQREVREIIRNGPTDGTVLRTHRIEPGTFQMGEEQVTVTLTKPFEMASTPTTQTVWKKIADLANKKFPRKYQIDPDPSVFKGDTHPVERISYETVLIWIKALNDLSKAGEPQLVDIISAHEKGDIYRLPTEAEWEFVATGRGRFNDSYFFGSDKSKLDDYAWYDENSGRSTHPVAQKIPLIIDGNEFYDMLGNVEVWVKNWSGELKSGKNPQGPKIGMGRMVRGGHWNANMENLFTTERDSYNPGSRFSHLGFRLVKDVR